MAIQYINTGSSANAGNGDSLRSAFIKVNNNFAYLGTSPGYTGSTGTVGFTGSRGATGFTGSTGTQGVIGFTGSTGTQGEVGFTGSAGVGIVNSGQRNRLAHYSSTGTILSEIPSIVYVAGSTTTYPRLQIGDDISSPMLRIVRNSHLRTLDENGFLFAQHHDVPDVANFTYYRTRGSSTTQTNLLAGDDIADIVFAGYYDTASYGALVTVSVEGNPTTAGHIPTKYQIGTDNGTVFKFGAVLSSSSTLHLGRNTAFDYKYLALQL